MSDGRLWIKLRELRDVVCFDGEPDVRIIPQMAVGRIDEQPPADEATWAWRFSRVTLQRGQTLEDLKRELLEQHGKSVGRVDILPRASRKRHQHIGEYGSPKIHRCNALDRY